MLDQSIADQKTANLSNGAKFQLDDIPLVKFYDQALYIEKQILPAISKKSGLDSDDYRFFSEIYKSLLYAVMIIDRGNSLILKVQQLTQINKIQADNLAVAERELLKYTTIEDLMMTHSMDKIAANIKHRIENILTKKP